MSESELEKFYDLADTINITKIKDAETRKQVARFRNLALVLVEENNVFRQQMESMTRGEEVAAGLRKQLLEQGDQQIKQHEKAIMSFLRVRREASSLNKNPRDY